MSSSWTIDSAIQELDFLIAETSGLTKERRLSESHTHWIARTLAFLEEVFGRNSRYFVSIAALTWRREGSVIVGGWSDPEGAVNPTAAIERVHQEAYVYQLESTRGLLLGAKDQLLRVNSIEGVYEGRDTAPETSTILKIVNLAEFKLRKVMKETPQFEKEVQDGFEALLIGADVSYSREIGGIEYSSKTYTPDFVMPKLDLAIDVKICARDGREKEIIGEINDDILAYQTKFRNIFFIVYDVGRIQDVDRFSASFEAHENVIVRVVKH